MILKNKRTGEEQHFSEKEYMNRKDLWNEREYKFIRMDQKVLVPARSPSITEQFDPSRKLYLLSKSDKNNALVKELIEVRPNQSEISLRSAIVKAGKIVLISAPDLKRGDWDRIDKWKELKRYFDQNKIPVVLLTASSEEVIREFRSSNNFDVPVFINDATELKTISRSNPSLIYLEKGVVKGKFTSIQTPSVERFAKEYGE
jgi:hypothetical protein